MLTAPTPGRLSDGQPNGASTSEREDIADMRIHEMCVCVCVHTYVHLHMCISAYASIPRPMKKMPLFQSLELEMTSVVRRETLESPVRTKTCVFATSVHVRSALTTASVRRRSISLPLEGVHANVRAGLCPLPCGGPGARPRKTCPHVPTSLNLRTNVHALAHKFSYLKT